MAWPRLCSARGASSKPRLLHSTTTVNACAWPRAAFTPSPAAASSGGLCHLAVPACASPPPPV
eukprot:8907368-Lingulodinium_polyedra.AAC.1